MSAYLNTVIGETASESETDALAQEFNQSYKAEHPDRYGEQPQAETPADAEPETVTEDPATPEAKPEVAKPEPESKEETKTPEGQKPESNYSKAAKDRARREKTWDEINRRKEELEQRERALQAQAQQVPRQRSPLDEEEIDLSPPKPRFRGAKIAVGDEEYGLKELTAIRNDARANGNEQAFAQLDQLRDKLIARDTLAQTQLQERQYDEAFQTEAAELVRQRPELRDENTELGAHVADISRAVGHALKRVPNAAKLIVDVAEFRIKAGKYDAAVKEADTLKARIKELEGRTAIGGAPPSQKANGKKAVDDADDDELRQAFTEMVGNRFANR